MKAYQFSEVCRVVVVVFCFFAFWLTNWHMCYTTERREEKKKRMYVKSYVCWTIAKRRTENVLLPKKKLLFFCSLGQNNELTNSVCVYVFFGLHFSLFFINTIDLIRLSMRNVETLGDNLFEHLYIIHSYSLSLFHSKDDN